MPAAFSSAINQAELPVLVPLRQSPTFAERSRRSTTRGPVLLNLPFAHGLSAKRLLLSRVKASAR